MEKLADQIEKMLGGTLALYRELDGVLEQEKGYIVEMAVDSLWETIACKKQIALKLEKLRQKMQALLEKRAVELNMDIETFKLSDFIKKMPDSEAIKSNLRKMRRDLETYKITVVSLAAANKKYIDEHLSVINDIFSMFAETAHRKQYNNYGNLLEKKEKNRLIHAEV